MVCAIYNSIWRHLHKAFLSYIPEYSTIAWPNKSLGHESIQKLMATHLQLLGILNIILNLPVSSQLLVRGEISVY